MQKGGVLLVRLDRGLVIVEAGEPDVDRRDVLVERPSRLLILLKPVLDGVHQRRRVVDALRDDLLGGRQLGQTPAGRVGRGVERLECD